MQNSYVEVDVLVNGKPVKQFAHQNKLFVQSNHQTEYSLRIRNPSWARKLFVITVDGINVIDGKAGGTSKMGYIISGYNTSEIKGFRTSNEVVHPFKFSSKRRSYAAKSEETQGDTRNCGVIGVEVYDEYVEPVTKITWIHSNPITYPNHRPWGTPVQPYEVTYTCGGVLGNVGARGARGVEGNLSDNTTFVSNLADTSSQVRCFNASSTPLQDQVKRAKAANFDMGTEFSKQEVRDVVSEVEFETGNKLTSVSIFYASREALQSMGVPVNRENQINAFPQAFPSRFCKPPC